MLARAHILVLAALAACSGGSPTDEREAMLADPGVATRVAVQLSFRLRRPGRFAQLADRYRALAIQHPNLSWSGVASLPPSAVVLALARAVASAVPLGSSARRDAMGQVSRNGDASDLPEIRRSLQSSDVTEVISALEAIARPRDQASRAAVAGLVRHPNASVSRNATATLGRL